MRFTTKVSILASTLALLACAEVKNDTNQDDVDGGSSGGNVSLGGASSGGSTSSSGGVIGAGATTSSGSSASTGGASTGGASTGGAATGGASTGGASTGGASTGGASTGGAATGGTVGTGDCAGTEAFVAGAGTKYASGAKVVDTCETSVSCSGKTGQYEFSCSDQYNCGSQDPGTTNWGTSPWTLSKQCNP